MNQNFQPPRPMDPRPPMPSGAFDTQDIITAESLLAALRRGNNQDKPLEIGFGDFRMPCRLLSAPEELKIVVQATQRAKKENITGEKLEISVSYAVMTDMLYAACKVGNSFLPVGFLEMLSAKELGSLYDQYTDINAVVNPNIQELSHEEIMGIVDGIKKKTVLTRNLFSYQLRAVGKYFLETVIPALQTASERG